MTELELSLAALAPEVDWPATPTLALPHVLPRRSRPRLVIAVALAALVVAVGAAFAVPSARSAILRFFGFGGVTIERVATLPSAQERPLAATLGTPVSRDAAESVTAARCDSRRSTATPGSTGTDRSSRCCLLCPPRRS